MIQEILHYVHSSLEGSTIDRAVLLQQIDIVKMILDKMSDVNVLQVIIIVLAKV